MLKFSLHNHTEQSHDSVCDPRELCRVAEARGLAGVALTDHCDIENDAVMDIRTPLVSAAQAEELDRGEFAGRLRVFAGIEIGDPGWDPPLAARILTERRFDIVIGSVHTVRHPKAEDSYSRVDFSVWSDDEIQEFYEYYLDELYDMACHHDFDVLAHLTCPLSYLIGKYHRPVDQEAVRGRVDDILRRIIRDGRALEVNTTCYRTREPGLLPDGRIVRRYAELGGKLVTVGSDAHVAERVDHGVDAGYQLLRDCGFTAAVYYENRKPIPYRIDKEELL